MNALGHLFAPGNPRPSPFRLIKISKVCVSLCILKLMRVFSSQSARPSPKAVRRALDFPTYLPFQNTERCETKQPMSLVANALLLAGTSHDGTAIDQASCVTTIKGTDGDLFDAWLPKDSTSTRLPRALDSEAVQS